MFDSISLATFNVLIENLKAYLAWDLNSDSPYAYPHVV